MTLSYFSSAEKKLHNSAATGLTVVSLYLIKNESLRLPNPVPIPTAERLSRGWASMHTLIQVTHGIKDSLLGVGRLAPIWLSKETHLNTRVNKLANSRRAGFFFHRRDFALRGGEYYGALEAISGAS